MASRRVSWSIVLGRIGGRLICSDDIQKIPCALVLGKQVVEFPQLAGGLQVGDILIHVSTRCMRVVEHLVEPISREPRGAPWAEERGDEPRKVSPDDTREAHNICYANACVSSSSKRVVWPMEMNSRN